MSSRHTKAAHATKSLRNRIAGMTVASVAAAAAVVGGIAVSTDAPSAEAARGTSVVFGDSLTANPDIYNYLAGKGVPLPDPVLSGSGCGTDNRFSDAFGAGSDTTPKNYSCAGASYRTGGMHIIDQVNKAKADGALRNATQVALLAGTNDTYPYVINDHLPVPVIQNNLRDSMIEAARAAKAAAPGARVKIVGMPQITNAAGEVCPVNVVPGDGTPLPLIQVGEIEAAIEQAGRDAASATGAEFVTLKDVTKGHEMCSADRWITGIIDTTSARRNLPLHMTDDGLSAVGRHAGKA